MFAKKLFLSIFCLLLLVGCSSYYEEVKTEHVDLIKKYGSIDFESKAWKKFNSEKRGKMVKSLFEKHKFKGKNVKVVNELLGYRTCYQNTGHIPCYEIIYEGYIYQLVFGVGYLQTEDINKKNSILSNKLYFRGT